MHLPPEVLAALTLCVVAVIAMLPSLVKSGSAALLEHAAAKARRKEADAALMQARAAEIQAAAAMRVAEAKSRESQARITESDAQTIRDTVDALQRRVEVLEKDLREARELHDRTARERDEALGAVLYETQARSVEESMRKAAEEREHALRAEFAAYHAEANAAEERAGRKPRPTPPAFRIDHTQPYGVQR